MIVVTAPTGRIGSKILDHLVQQLNRNDEQIRVIVRDEARLSPAVRERVDVVQGSHRDPAVVDRAFDGADSLFWLVPAERSAPSIYDAYVSFSVPAAAAIVTHGVERVVTISALGRGTGIYAGHVSASLAMEDLLRSTGTHLRALANATFMDNVSRQADSLVHDGVLTGTLPGDLALPTVATEDIAAVAAGLLVDRSWSGQDTIDLLGPEALSPNDQAAILSDVLHRTVVYRRGDRDADKAAFLEYGFSDAIAQALIDMDIAKEHGIDDLGTRSPQHATPTTFAEWASESFGRAQA
jgi:uncharacterized protein YbjT (DUF2867 family)